jgi:hypothetical protein
MGEWSAWRAFPNPRDQEYLHAPLGPGVYELRNKRTGELVCPGHSLYLAYRMTSLLPREVGGCGTRMNSAKRDYVHNNLVDIEYRTRACATKIEAQETEAGLKKDNHYVFPF